MTGPRRGRDADPTPLEWLRDLGLALLCLAVLLGSPAGAALVLGLLVARALG